MTYEMNGTIIQELHWIEKPVSEVLAGFRRSISVLVAVGMEWRVTKKARCQFGMYLHKVLST